MPWYDDVVLDAHPSASTAIGSSRPSPASGVEINEEVARQHPFVQEVIGGKEAILARDGSKANW